MAHYQSGTDQYGNPIRQTDEYGNVISETAQYGDPLRRTGEFRETDQYGNPVRQTGEYGNPIGTGTGTGTGGTYETGGYGGTGYGGGHHQQHKEHGGILHRSGSSSSSSVSSKHKLLTILQYLLVQPHLTLCSIIFYKIIAEVQILIGVAVSSTPKFSLCQFYIFINLCTVVLLQLKFAFYELI